MMKRATLVALLVTLTLGCAVNGPEGKDGHPIKSAPPPPPSATTPEVEPTTT